MSAVENAMAAESVLCSVALMLSMAISDLATICTSMCAGVGAVDGQCAGGLSVILTGTHRGCARLREASRVLAVTIALAVIDQHPYATYMHKPQCLK